MKRLQQLLEAEGGVDLQAVKEGFVNLIRKAQDTEAECRALLKQIKGASLPIEKAYNDTVLATATALVKALQEAEKSIGA